MFGNWLIHLSGGTSFGAVMVGTAGAALGTNLINNVPMALVMVSALGGIQHASPVIPAWVHRSYDVWVRPWTEPYDCWLPGNRAMVTNIAPAQR
jgi:hypothetical protein